MDVATAAHAARRHNNALTRLGKVGQGLDGLLGCGVKLSHNGTHGNAKDKVLAVATVPAGALAVRAALGLEVVLVAVVDQRRELRVGLDDHRAASAAVAAVGAALGNKGLAPKGHAACAAVAALDVDVG